MDIQSELYAEGIRVLKAHVISRYIPEHRREIVRWVLWWKFWNWALQWWLPSIDVRHEGSYEMWVCVVPGQEHLLNVAGSIIIGTRKIWGSPTWYNLSMTHRAFKELYHITP